LAKFSAPLEADVEPFAEVELPLVGVVLVEDDEVPDDAAGVPEVLVVPDDDVVPVDEVPVDELPEDEVPEEAPGVPAAVVEPDEVDAEGVVLLDVDAEGVVLLDVDAEGVAFVEVDDEPDALVDEVGVPFVAPFVAKVGIGKTARATGLGPTLIRPTDARFTTSSMDTLFDELLVTKAVVPSAVILMSVGSVPTAMSETLFFASRS